MTAATELDWTVALAAARARALSAGALVPIAVEGEIVVDNGVEFRVEWISSLAMKDMAAIPRVGDKAKDFNPFLPYDENLFVTEVSDTHVAILNKFPSWDGHFLLITRAFVEQELPLDIADADALARALSGVDGYAFYNSGGAAGASQRHRHLQIIPGFVTPIAELLPADIPLHVMSAAPRLPYRHAYCRLDRAKFERGGADGAFLHGLITEACRTAGLDPTAKTMAPYNLMASRDWLIVTPRATETVDGLSLSALSYSGLIGLRTPDQIETVRRIGPFSMLEQAAGQARSSGL